MAVPSSVPSTAPHARVTYAWWALAFIFAAVALAPLVVAWDQAVDLGHGWAAPLLVAYLYWERWTERPGGRPDAFIPAWWWPLVGVLLLAALILRLLLIPFPLSTIVLLPYVFLFWIAATAAAWLTAGRPGLRWVGGPLLVFAGTLPWPATFEFSVIAPLRALLASATAEVCYLGGISALASGTTLHLAQTSVGVDETCGGMRSLQAGMMAALFLGEWLRLRWPARVLLVAVGLASAILGNFLRILLLVWRADVGGEAALQAVHDLAGWLALATSLVITGLVARALRPVTPVSSLSAAPRHALPRTVLAGVAALVLGFLGVELATRAWYTFGAARRAGTVPQWTVTWPTAAPGFRPIPLTIAGRELLRPDRFASAEWRDADQQYRTAYYIEWTQGQIARYAPIHHNPTICFPMSGCELVRTLPPITVAGSPGAPLPFQAYIFRRSGVEFAVAFLAWDPSRGRPLAGPRAGWSAWLRERWTEIAEARADQPGQFLAVTTWGPAAEEQLAEAIAELITPSR